MKIATMAIAAMSAFAAMAQIVERPRPEGWERLVTGGRFMDRFEKPQVIGNGWTDKCWGGDNVRPRDVRNGIEDSEYSYWGVPPFFTPRMDMHMCSAFSTTMTPAQSRFSHIASAICAVICSCI